MLAQVREANRPRWWREYANVVPGWFDNYVGVVMLVRVVDGALRG